MNMIFKKLGTKHRGTTPYHPRINSAVEQFNSVLGQTITKYLIEHPIREWDNYLEQALFAMHIHTHTSTKRSPFYLLYRVNPRLLGDAVEPTCHGYLASTEPLGL